MSLALGTLGGMWREDLIRDSARANHGLVDRTTVLEHGGTDSIIQGRVASGQWRLVNPGVYDLNVTDRGWIADVRAATLAAGPEALASHRTAGTLWGLEGFASRVIEVTVPFTKEPMPWGVVVHRTRRVLPVALVSGIPVTSIERTLLDLAQLLPEPALEKAYLSALRQKLTTPDRMADLLREQGGPGVRGTKKLRRVMVLADEGTTGSVAEVDTARLIRTAPIPTPALQHRIRLPNGENAYPDFSWPDRMKIVEVDGYGAHSSPDQHHNDLIRQNLLMELGWEIRRFSARKVRRDPDAVVAEIVRFVTD